MSSNIENLHRRKKLTMGRRKIEMKKIQKKASLQVTFTKRRTGLFKKASELCVLCGSELAIIVQSPAKKFYTFNSPSVESMLHRFNTGDGFITNDTILVDYARSEYEEAVRMLKEKKMEVIGTAMNHNIKESGFWWDQQIEGMDLQGLEGYLESLEDLRKNVSCRIEEMEKLLGIYSSPSSVSAVPSQGSMEDTFGGLPVQSNHNKQQLMEKLVEFDMCDASDDDDDANGFSNIGTNLTCDLDFDDLLFPSNYGNSTTCDDLEAFLGGF